MVKDPTGFVCLLEQAWPERLRVSPISTVLHMRQLSDLVLPCVRPGDLLHAGLGQGTLLPVSLVTIPQECGTRACSKKKRRKDSNPT